MTRRNRVTKVTGNLGQLANRADRVATARRAGGDGASNVQLDVRRQSRSQGRVHRSTGGLVGFQGPLINSGVNLTHIVNTGIGLGGGTRFHEVRDSDSREQADDGHDNHDFNQRKARLAGILVLFHFIFTFSSNIVAERCCRRVI